MESKNYIFNIDNPCSENWDKMTSNDSGKFCNACAKNVIDFTSLSDSQIIKIIQKSSGNVCGRMRSDQLNREMFPINEKPSRSFFYQFLASAFLFFTSIKLQANFLKENLKNKTEIFSGFDISSKILEENPATDDTNKKYIFKGKVIEDVIYFPLSHVKISVYSDTLLAETISDSMGKFNLTLPDSINTNIVKIVIKKQGYIYKSFNLKKEEINNFMNIILSKSTINENQIIMGGCRPLSTVYHIDGIRVEKNIIPKNNDSKRKLEYQFNQDNQIDTRPLKDR